MKFSILSEKEIVDKICELNPLFQNNGDKNEQRILQPMGNSSEPSGDESALNLSSKLSDSLELGEVVKPKPVPKGKETTNQPNTQNQELAKRKQEQERFMAEQAQLQRLQHQEQLKQRQAIHEKQQQIKMETLEAKRKEKYLQRERKTREKWFEYILNREQQSTRPQFSINEPGSSNIFIDAVEDMQEKYLKDMPELKQLHVDSNEDEDEEEGDVDDSTEWLADFFQVVEFLNTFGEKLKSSLSQESATNEDNFQFPTILTNAESFRQCLENKSEKLKKELSNMVQLLLKCLMRNMGQTSSNAESNEMNEEESDDLYQINRLNELECNDLTYSELLRLYLKRAYNALKQRRQLTRARFNIDVTKDLFERLGLWTEMLENKTFEWLKPVLKTSILAFLCDELLSSDAMGQEEEETRGSNIVLQQVDQAVDDFNQVKHEKWELETKARQLKTEKISNQKEEDEEKANANDTPENNEDDKLQNKKQPKVKLIN